MPVANQQRSIRWLAPFTVSFVPALRSSQRTLYSGGRVGLEVHAASSIPQRRIWFERALLSNPAELRRIVTHELFHFAWIRLGNGRRREWETLLAAEHTAGGRGELGWSAEWRKRGLQPADVSERTRQWREYACESFCDSAAWLLTGARPHDEVTLAPRHARHRAAWIVHLFRETGVSI